MVHNIKVLLVDDEADFRQLMTAWLEGKGYSVTAVSGGEEAISLVKKDDFNILFLDLRMPGMDGREVLKRIREFNKELPIIVITAYVNELTPGEMGEHSVSGVFYKEKNLEEVLPLLESALKAHKGLKEE